MNSHFLRMLDRLRFYYLSFVFIFGKSPKFDCDMIVNSLSIRFSTLDDETLDLIKTALDATLSCRRYNPFLSEQEDEIEKSHKRGRPKKIKASEAQEIAPTN